MGFFSNFFKRISNAQTSMGDDMVRLGKETGRLDLTRDAAETAYKTAGSVRELDGLTTAAENKILNAKRKGGIQLDYTRNNGATEADLDFLKQKPMLQLSEEQKQISQNATLQTGIYAQMQSMAQNMQVRAGTAYQPVPQTTGVQFREDEYGNISVDTQHTLMQYNPDDFRTQMTYFSDMYKKNGAIITEDGSIIKDVEDTHNVTVEAVSTGLKPMPTLEALADKAESTAMEVHRATDEIIADSKLQGAFAVHPKQTEDEIRKLAQKVTEISAEIEAELDGLKVKDELKQEIFGWIKEAANKRNKYICAEIQNAIIFISNQLDADKVMNPSIKNPSVIIAGLDDRGVPEKLIQFDTIADCRRELGEMGEKFTDMTMLRELSNASREFERIAQLTTSEHIEDVVFRLDKAMQDYVSDIKFDGANAIVDKVVQANNLREQAYERIKAYVEERVLGDSEFIKNNYPEKYESFFKEVGSIYMGSKGDIANIDVMPIEHTVNFEETKNGAEPIKDLSFLLTVTNKSGEMATINYDTDMNVTRVALGTVEQGNHSIEWSSADMQLVFDAKEGTMGDIDRFSDFVSKLPPVQEAIDKFMAEKGIETPELDEQEQGEER